MSVQPLFSAIGPEICIGFVILCLVFIERFHGFSWRLSRILSILGLIISICLLSTVFSGPVLILDSVYISDTYTAIFKLVILVISLLLMIGNPRHRSQFSGADFHLPVLFGTLGGMMSAGASDLFMLYLSVELTAFSSIFLLMMLKSNLRSYRAYFFNFIGFQAFGSVCFLTGAGCIQLSADGSRYALIHNALQHTPDSRMPFFLIGLVLMLCGLSIKWSMIPSHYYSLRFFPENAIQFFVWFFLIITTSMTAALGRLIGMLQPILDRGVVDLFIVLAAGILLAGGIASLRAIPVRKFGLFLLAQQGFIILAVLADTARLSTRGSTNGLLIISLICLSNSFFLIFPKRFQTQGSSVDRHPGDLCGLFIVLGTLAGVPVTLGFYSRLFTIEWLIADQHYIICGLVALASLLLLVVSIQLTTLFARASSSVADTMSARIESICLCCLSLLLIGFGVNPSGMIRLFESIIHIMV